MNPPLHSRRPIGLKEQAHYERRADAIVAAGAPWYAGPLMALAFVVLAVAPVCFALDDAQAARLGVWSIFIGVSTGLSGLLGYRRAATRRVRHVAAALPRAAA